MSVIVTIQNCALVSEDMKKYDHISNISNLVNALHIPSPAEWCGCCGILELLLLLRI